MKSVILKIGLFAAGCVTGVLSTQMLHAQSGIQRNLLQRIDVPQNAAYEALMATAEIPAGSTAGRHTHPGTEMSYVLSGEVSLEVSGQTPRTLKAGDSFIVPTGSAHDARVIGTSAAKVLAVYVVEKGKPLSTAAP
ncbi:MAG: cupin domain-containing protein [Steroidobacteraceae bacterium]